MTYDELIEKMANFAADLAMKNKTYLILSHPEKTRKAPSLEHSGGMSHEVS